MVVVWKEICKFAGMKGLVYMAAASALLLAASCGNHTVTSGPVLTVDSLGINDSLSYGRCSAEVTIAGLYPDSGATPLVDSVRNWLNECLSWGTFSGQKPIIMPTRAEMAKPQSLINHLSSKILASAKRDFIEFDYEDDISVGYEYQIYFEPAYQSDSVLTYTYNTYCYLGGAHGSSANRVASFAIPSGVLLTYDNVFLPDRRKELIARIRNGLWSQYFSPTVSEPSATLADVLLINPADLELPASGPEFGPGGITFTYGQYEIAPYSAGMPSCTLRYTDLHPLMQAWVIPLISNIETR